MNSRTTLLGLLLLASTPAVLADEWEIAPVDDPRVPVGKLSIIGGAVGTEPMLFVLKNLTIAMPIQVTLAALDAGQPVGIDVYKDSPEQPLLTASASDTAPATLRFRTDEVAYFQLRAADGARYQLMAWVGPEIEIEADSPIVPVSAYPTAGMTDASAASTRSDADPTPAVPAGPSAAPVLALGSGPTILLGLILGALVVIIVLLVRRGGKVPTALVLGAILASTALAQERGVPSLVKQQEKVAPSISEALQKLRDQLGPLKDLGKGGEGFKITKPTATTTGTEFAVDKGSGYATGKDRAVPIKVTKDAAEKTSSGKLNLPDLAGQSVEATKLLISFLEEFGLIDPREGAVQKNLNPPGTPLLLSRCAKDPECRACYKRAEKDLLEARSLLEEQYVIYRRAELQAGRIIELADAAAGLSPYAKLLWTVQKDSPSGGISEARQKLYTTYDTNLVALLKMLNDALIAQASCERDAFGDLDWYNRYGMAYYTFMRDRYTRR